VGRCRRRPCQAAAAADAFEVDPGVLLGPDMVDANAAEQTLLRWLRAMEIAPHEAILRLSGA
jgi:hypothetical protein